MVGGSGGGGGGGVSTSPEYSKENTLVTKFSLITFILDDLQQFCKGAEVMRLHTNDI